MEVKHIVLGLVEAACWYLFFWFGLDSIKRGRNALFPAAILLVLFYLAFWTCPWLRHTEMWKRL